MTTQLSDSNPQEIANHFSATGRFHPESATTYLTLSSGEVLVVPTSMLRPAPSASLSQEQQPEAACAEATQQVIPIIEEHLTVSKRLVERERVRIHKFVEEHVEEGEVSLTAVAWNVERVPIGKPVAQRPEIRQEGETTVYPIVEEQVVVTRQLMLKEEVRVTRQLTTRTETVSQVLRRERVEVEHLQGTESVI